jgi:hypothetical protein
VGHWRSGTTHLHNLISRDPNFACPTAYQCLFPEHFIFSQAGGALFNAIAPPKRPMDNVAFSADTPHEDEFALAADSGLSPYICIWFPRTARRPYSGFDPCELDPKDLEKWKASLQLFMKKLTLSEGKRIALKSPPHFGRIRTILEIFPQAKFVHIVRDPYMVYASTHKLWRSGLAWSHLQIPTPELVDETILSWYVELFGLFERDRGLIPPGALHELKFEDLEISPMECMERMYAELGIPGFPDFKPALSAYLESIKSYEKNRHALSEADREKVAARWRSTFEKYGYPL